MKCAGVDLTWHATNKYNSRVNHNVKVDRNWFHIIVLATGSVTAALNVSDCSRQHAYSWQRQVVVFLSQFPPVAAKCKFQQSNNNIAKLTNRWQLSYFPTIYPPPFHLPGSSVSFSTIRNWFEAFPVRKLNAKFLVSKANPKQQSINDIL